jgi:hypothetical protein
VQPEWPGIRHARIITLSAEPANLARRQQMRLRYSDRYQDGDRS